MQHITIVIPTKTPRPPKGGGDYSYVYDEGRGKKWALRKGIEAATTEYVWLTDDDVVLPEVTEQQLLDAIGDADMLILPLRMVSSATIDSRNTSPLKGVGGSLQIAEYAAIQALTIRSAQRGHPVMCSGANLLVRRDTWLELYNELHPEIPSGDDMFLLEAMKRHGKKIVTIPVSSPSGEAGWGLATIEAVPTWRAFFRQRMRWAGKAPKYTDRDILVCGATVAILEFLQILCPLLVLLYYPLVLRLLRHAPDPEQAKLPPLRGIGGLLIYPYYMFICLIGGMLHPKRW